MQLTETQTGTLINIFRNYFINTYELLYFIDQKQADSFKQRNSYYHEIYKSRKKAHVHGEGCKHGECGEEEVVHGGGCCGPDHLDLLCNIYIPENDQTKLENLIYMQRKPYKLKGVLSGMVNGLGEKFFRIKKSGLGDGEEWTQEIEQYLVKEVLKNGVRQHFRNLI